MPPNTVRGRRLICDESGEVVAESAGLMPWQFTDYSWPCLGCGGRHCSECFYAEYGDSILVAECGRWPRAPRKEE